ncbi:MAG: hypothetical protein J3R72DRAFT_524895 [Linnemannia gamsii]|nr:MAG: hypothetical protein J3R72DRAFT_524895 [Linnemannia gamsii]
MDSTSMCDGMIKDGSTDISPGDSNNTCSPHFNQTLRSTLSPPSLHQCTRVPASLTIQAQFKLFRICICGLSDPGNTWELHPLDEPRSNVKTPQRFIKLFAPTLLANTRAFLKISAAWMLRAPFSTSTRTGTISGSATTTIVARTPNAGSATTGRVKAGLVAELTVTLPWRLSPSEFGQLADCATYLGLTMLYMTERTSSGENFPHLASQQNSLKEKSTAYVKSLLRPIVGGGLELVSFDWESSLDIVSCTKTYVDRDAKSCTWRSRLVIKKCHQW